MNPATFTRCVATSGKMASQSSVLGALGNKGLSDVGDRDKKRNVDPSDFVYSAATRAIATQNYQEKPRFRYFRMRFIWLRTSAKACSRKISLRASNAAKLSS